MAGVLRGRSIADKQRCGMGRLEAADGAVGLQREAAHNLALIYKASGASALARQVLREHFTI